MDRARLKTLILYHIYSSKVLVGILLLIMFVNLLLGIAFKHSINSAGSMDIASYIFAMFVGYELFREVFRFLYKGIIIKHNKTEPTYTKTSLFLCEKRRFFMARTEKGVVATI